MPFARNADASFNYPRAAIGWDTTVTSFVELQLELNSAGVAEVKGNTAASTNMVTTIATADLANNSRFFGTITYMV